MLCLVSLSHLESTANFPEYIFYRHWCVLKVHFTSCGEKKNTSLQALFEAEWRMYASVNCAIIGSDDGLTPGRCQAIIWTNAGMFLTGPLGTKIQWTLKRNMYIFIHESVFENVVCEMVAILSQPQCVNPGGTYTKLLTHWPLGDSKEILEK